MCGIVGIVSSRDRVDRDCLIGMRDSMRHRGPDDAGYWSSPDGRVGLAHRRLAVVDLSPRGHQPMADATGDIQIVFNGEIYNHSELRAELARTGVAFQSATDTEVIIEAYRRWGTACLERLNGMFAFAIYDAAEQRLFLARDRAGEKPLFLYHSDNRFSFASELKALMADPQMERRLDLEGMEYYLAFGYVPGALSILQGVRKLPPGHAAILDVQTNDVRTWRYWKIPEADPSPNHDAEALAFQLQELLEDSVRRQLITDVPLGVLLSGGIDSSIVTAIAASLSSEPIRTFTATFPGHESHNEAPYARKVASYFGTKHSELPVEPATVDLLPMLAAQFDEPMCDSSIIPTYLVSRLIRQQATVALGGDGADELFGGYPTYQRALSVATVQQWLPQSIRYPISRAAESLLPLGMRGRSYLTSLKGSATNAVSQLSVSFDRQSRRKLVPSLGNNSPSEGRTPERYKQDICQSARGLPGLAMALDFHTYLSSDILVKVDRASMLNSLEVRAPFLDQRIIEFAFQKVPNALRANRDRCKILLRIIAERLLPDQLDLTRKKQGFAVPMAKWLTGDWGKLTREVLRDADPLLFDRRELTRLLDGQTRGLLNSERLFGITMFELWRRHYNIVVA